MSVQAGETFFDSFLSLFRFVFYLFFVRLEQSCIEKVYCYLDQQSVTRRSFYCSRQQMITAPPLTSHVSKWPDQKIRNFLVKKNTLKNSESRIKMLRSSNGVRLDWLYNEFNSNLDWKIEKNCLIPVRTTLGTVRLVTTCKPNALRVALRFQNLPDGSAAFWPNFILAPSLILKTKLLPYF